MSENDDLPDELKGLGFVIKYSAPARYDKTAFLKTLVDLVRCPERSSSSILRADILSECRSPRYCVEPVWSLERTYVRRIVAKKSGLDADMIQACHFYCQPESENCLVIFEVDEGHQIPFYHPQVAALGFIKKGQSFHVAIVPLELDHAALERLTRTTQRLCDVITKHSNGNFAGYQKRVNHDVVVAKELWQDTYTSLKHKYAQGYIEQWVESTDPLKHVFEDLAIAAFILALRIQERLSFVDVACGNGLLVDILIREGCHGFGFDARMRKSWVTYEYADLRELVLSAIEFGGSQSSEGLHNGQFPKDAFLIGNHPDELTPYIPLLAALSQFDAEEEQSSPGFVIIPCCTYTFDGTKHASLSTAGGRYASYVEFIQGICESVGWTVEREALRIPSTRNIALIGRMRHAVEGSGDPEERRARLKTICNAIIDKHGGNLGFFERALALRYQKTRKH